MKSIPPPPLAPEDYPRATAALLTLLGYGVLNALRADIAYFILLCLGAVACTFWEEIRPRLASSRALNVLVLLGCFTFLFCTEFSGAARAIWLDNIESWMSGAFPQSADLAELIFNVLRGFYVLYLIISGIQVFIAGRRQEGLWEAAQLPLLSLLIIGVVDVVSGFIVT